VSPRAVRAATVAIAIAAGVNMAIAVILAIRDPARASDLSLMYEWCRGWIVGAERRYTVLHDAADYPPYALVFLSPLGLLPRPLIVPVWTALGVVLAAVLPYLAVRCAGQRRGRAVLPALLFWCWTSARTLLQFTALSLALSLLSALTADARPILSGILLGAALFKPHIAGPFALWMLVTRRFRVLAVAGGVVLAGFLVYAARVGDTPIDTLRGYWPWLVEVYSGEHALTGRTSIRGLIAAVTANAAIVDALWVAAALGLLAAAALLAMRDPMRPLHAGGLAIPALFCLWALAAIYHNVNNLILMLPAFVFLWFADTGARPAHCWFQIACLQAVLMLDIPTRLTGIVPPRTLAAFLVDHFDRLLVLACFVDVAVLWVSVARRSSPAQP
jgi:hypothetical protein